LPPADVSWDRVIRTTVGLRPHRPSGFALRAEKLDAKTLIHNYGHGGAGISLSWGTGQLAAEMALETGERRAAVLGCGALGLAAARQLQRRGFEVTIYAMTLPPHTTSNMALAGFTPTSGLVALDRRTPEWEAKFRRAAEIAYTELQLLAGAGYGVSWIYNYTGVEDLREVSGTNILLPHWPAEQVILGPGEHPFPARFAARRAFLRIEPSLYLAAVLRDFLLFGGRLVVRKFDAPRDLMTLDEPVLVNCTGLGSHQLFSDSELTPLKGQLTALVPQPEITYAIQGTGRRPGSGPQSLGLHMLPRSDGIILGGTSEKDVWTLEPNEEERQRIVEGHRQFFAAMRAPRPGARAPTTELPREVPRLEGHFGFES
jgi:glycine/D-amino acid oxidase-like deaminating enzyme